jgi:DNA replication ATP-dependent helicase Dna2
MPLQKSFSDQNHSAKSKVRQRVLTQYQHLTHPQQQHRPQWSRNKSFQGPQPNQASLKPLQEKPPIPVSTATKNKLSNFQFHGQPNVENDTKAVISLLSHDEKENEGAKQEKADDVRGEHPKNSSPEQPKLPEPAPRDVPTTPAGRLALTELIGMGDIRRAVQNISPDERIEWNHEKDMIPGSGSVFGIRRAKKRARSSSPIGSPSAQASPHFNPKFEATSPQVDPGSELWGRYSLNGSNAPTPQGPSIPALTHLMHTSSPQPCKEGVTPRSLSGFRRANSCGNQFPKRRRVGGCESDDVFTESVTIGPSKLAVLIERVQEGLTQPKQPPMSTASSASNSFSTPLDKPSVHVADVKFIDHNPPEEPKAAPKPCLLRTESFKAKTELIVTPQAVKNGRSGSSDYGEFDDDELDENLMEIFVEVAAPTPQMPSNPPLRALHQAQDRYKPPPQVKGAESFESGTLKADSDEFDDSDEDLFAADLENIASQFDTKTHGKSKTILGGGAGVSGQRKPLARTKSESEDEFGDGGLDDLDFETAEATATQSIQQTANSLLPVRTRFP